MLFFPTLGKASNNQSSVILFTMQTTAKPEYMMIIDGPQHNQQSLSNFTFSNHRSNPNPQNLTSKQPPSYFGQSYQAHHYSIDDSKYKIKRVKDEYKSNHNSQKNGLSHSLVFSPKGIKNASDGQESENNYQSLTLKLEKALNKISFSEQNLGKPANKPHGIWKRSELQIMRKKKQTQRNRQLNEIERLKLFRQKPQINKNSKKILQQTGYEPIYIRFEQIVDQKKRRIEQTEHQKKIQKEQEEIRFQWQLNKHMKRPETTRTYDQYFSQMVRWKQKADEKTKLKLQQEKRKEISTATFKPKLNRRSQKIVAQQYRLPIYQRGLVKKNTHANSTFAPNTTRKPRK